MPTAVTTFAFATTLQSWSSIAALASGETNGLDTVNGNPADALFGKLVGKTKATTAGAGMKFSQTLTAWGVPASATVTAVSVALDKKCVTAPGSAIGSGSFNTKLNLNAGASLNTGPTQTLSTTADSVWTTLGTGSNAALSGLSDSTLTHTLEVDILYTLSTTSSALTSTTWQIDWDNVVVTITYTLPDVVFHALLSDTNAFAASLASVTFTPTAGDTVVVAAFDGSALAHGLPISDTANWSWATGPSIPSNIAGNNSVGAASYLAYNVPADSNTITVTPTSPSAGGNTSLRLFVLAYTPNIGGKYAVLDSMGTNVEGSDGALTVTASSVTTNASECVITTGGHANTAGIGVTTPTGYTRRLDIASSDYICADEILSSTGTPSAAYTDVLQWSMLILSLKAGPIVTAPRPRVVTLQSVTRASFW